KQSNPLPKKELTSPSPTVRMQIEHLDQLNYAVGELLTNHNQQSLQAEQIQTAMRQLYARLRQHHQLLSQLQDWLDYPTMPQAQTANGNGGTTFSTITSPFHAESLGSDKSSSSSYSLPMGFDALELEQYSKPQLVIQSLLDDTVQLTEAVDAVELYTRQSRQTQEKQGRLLLKTRGALIEGRMFPMGQLFERFPRVLQQLETLHHKPIELTLQGNEVLVDKAIGERLYDPILHLVRNAFDHGIEPVEVRQQRAKPEAGQLEIVAHHQGKHLIIEVRDDGEGLNFERIRQRAVERQLVSPEQANRLSPAQLTDLLFEPGFSTASQISSLSGRGVGLDVVRNQLQSLRGEIAVNSVAHQGTTFTLRIPLSLTIAKLLLCQANDRAYALLPDAVEQILIPQADQIRQREHCKSLCWGEGDEVCLVPIYALSELLNYPEQAQRLPSQTTVSSMTMTPLPYVLLIRHQEVLIGLEVDQMLGEQELVIRPLDPLLKTHDYIYGASILADGQLTLVLDGETLARKATALQADQNAVSEVDSFATETSVVPNHRLQLTGAPPLETPTKQGQKLLVVDDSITTRQTLKLTLQKAGYQVIQAQDGQEAVEQLLQHPNVQLVICDIEMPRMNGFEFLQHCQHDPALAEFPVMMLSSRSSDKHRLLAEQLGAIAYISKPYLEHKLLAMIAELLQVNVLSSVSE
ncbi:MAG: response regulator, partial [Cyanobacteria bacterium P01_F01_bin.86]